jgi:hypothetical protein
MRAPSIDTLWLQCSHIHPERAAQKVCLDYIDHSPALVEVRFSEFISHKSRRRSYPTTSDGTIRCLGIA